MNILDSIANPFRLSSNEFKITVVRVCNRFVPNICQISLAHIALLAFSALSDKISNGDLIRQLKQSCVTLNFSNSQLHNVLTTLSIQTPSPTGALVNEAVWPTTVISFPPHIFVSAKRQQSSGVASYGVSEKTVSYPPKKNPVIVFFRNHWRQKNPVLVKGGSTCSITS